MNIIEATQQHAPVIANLIMMAMTDECCLNLAGEGRTVADFARLMNQLTAADDTQYSYRNTLLAVTDEGEVAGAIVSYDGAKLHELREAFIEGARREFGVDHSGMDDETAAGEWYLDSLAVFPQFRGQGMANHGLPAALLVDKGNPKAERLYRSIGFEYVEDAMWGGHEMRRLRK